jgi:hypothetical protein
MKQVAQALPALQIVEEKLGCEQKKKKRDDEL